MCFERGNAHLFHIRVAGLQMIQFAARMGEYSLLVLAKRLFSLPTLLQSIPTNCIFQQHSEQDTDDEAILQERAHEVRNGAKG